jgi:hypothetical protein
MWSCSCGAPVQAVHGVAAVVRGDLLYRTCVIDAVLDSSPAAYVRRPPQPAESPPWGLSHLQFEAMIVAARTSTNTFDFALVAMLGLLGMRVFEACNASIDDPGEEHGHRVLRVVGKGTKIVLVPLPPAVGRAIDRGVGDRAGGPILLNRNGARMERNAATRRLHRLAAVAGVRMPRMHPHMLRHIHHDDAIDAGVSLRDVQIAARHADPKTTMSYDRARKNLDRSGCDGKPFYMQGPYDNPFHVLHMLNRTVGQGKLPLRGSRRVATCGSPRDRCRPLRWPACRANIQRHRLTSRALVHVRSNRLRYIYGLVLHRSMTSMPVWAKYLVLRVARSAPWWRHIAATWASAMLIAKPRRSRSTTISA